MLKTLIKRTTSCSPVNLINRAVISLHRKSLNTQVHLILKRHNHHHHHVCIVGSGPAGFYVAQHLLKLRSSSSKPVQIDLYEKLPVPFGLVRYGVAPDHPEVKNVINTFNSVLQSDRVRFVGNVEAGKEFQLKDLLECYHGVVLCYGATSDRLLNIPNEHLITSAREFVGWYNGLPYNSNLPVDLKSWKRAVIIGHGNVALDIARILLTDPDSLVNTDIAPYALEQLKESSIEEVLIVGRRGVLQVAFTIKEFREMLKLPGVGWDVRVEEEVGATESLARPRKRLTDLILKSAKESPKGCSKSWTLKFLRSPIEIRKENNQLVLKFQLNELKGEVPVGIGKTEEIRCDVAFRSIGYKGSKVFQDLPFDEERGVVRNDGGRVMEGVYCSGWAGQGPRGVILSTMQNSFEVAKLVSSDLDSSSSVIGGTSKVGFEGMKKHFSQRVTHYEDYLKIAKWELDNGKKLTNVGEMIRVCCS